MTTAIEMAKACGIAYYLTPTGTTEMHGTDRQIEAFAEMIRAQEREACAEVCDRLVFAIDHGGNEYRRPAHAEHCAAKIRERSNLNSTTS